MPYPWVQIVEGNPPSAAISLPPSIQRSQRPSVECRGLPPIHRPVGSVVVRNIGENIDLGSLANMFIGDEINCGFDDVKVTRGMYKPGKIPVDVLSRIRDVRNKRREENTLWDWYTLFRVSRGLLQQLASAPEAAPGMNLDVSYVSAFDQSRLPQPLRQMRPWLEEAWAEWIQQAMSLDDLRQMRLPILANALSHDMAAYHDGFCGQTVFREMYSDALTKAVSYQRLMPTADAKALVTSVVKTTIGQLRHADPEGRRKSRTHFLHRHSASVAGSRSSRLCLVCFVQPPEVFLPCECALCDTCYRGYGSITMSGTVITFDRCILCAMAFVSGCAVRLRPPTAGCRVLALDGGGVKGIVQLRILQMLQKVTGLPIRIFF
ncbi:hypothetical protein CABS02_14791 [Colletotrichum abscissum]|uniref:PNPLA domain-containing protein n=1 Tax=Colletotrichum abscissum TaxID=1671311 RepID=A0A9P9X0Y4_9PEZI|nr:hypothetical protein CABS02_14791 [Colletotrichum abscissum]